MLRSRNERTDEVENIARSREPNHPPADAITRSTGTNLAPTDAIGPMEGPDMSGLYREAPPHRNPVRCLPEGGFAALRRESLWMVINGDRIQIV